ncbi:response regulator [Endozoicomonas sp. Mp262]|uniref:response regulator n=1 Tax=Endozoicomonas sp. Mp262 TaxID=2919499 RepID=UPI0021D9F5DD
MNTVMAGADKVTLKKKLGMVLFFWFFVLSLGPLMVIGTLEYEKGKDSIRASQYQRLSHTNFLFAHRLYDFFDAVESNLSYQEVNAKKMVQDVKEIMMSGGMNFNNLFGNNEYQRVFKYYSPLFSSFISVYGYADFFVLDDKGGIIYSTSQNGFIGKSIFNSDIENTLFLKTVKASIESGDTRYGALRGHGDKNTLSSYMVKPLSNSGKNMGYIAVKLSAGLVQDLFKGYASMMHVEENINVYLVNERGDVVYGNQYSPVSKLRLNKGNPLYRSWLAHFDQETGEYTEKEEHMEHVHDGHSRHTHHEHHDEIENVTDQQAKRIQASSHIESYKGFHNETVLGMFHPVVVKGTSFFLVSEVLEDSVFHPIKDLRERLLYAVFIVFVFVFVFAALVARSVVKPINIITSWVKRVASGDYVQGKILDANSEISELSRSFKEMTEKLRNISNENEQRSWLQEGLASLNDSLRGDLSIVDLCENIVAFYCRYLGFQTGAMYVLSEDQSLHLMGTYAWRTRKQHANKFVLGDGLVGQAALEKKTIEIIDIPADYMVIESGLGSTRPCSVLIVPLIYEDELKGVLEFALLRSVSKEQSSFLKQSIENVAIAINSGQYRNRVNQLLEQTTKQSEVLKEQQEELKTVNEELESRAAILEESEEELKAQSEELQRSNAELEEKSELLLERKEEIEKKNYDIRQSKKAIEEKAKELEQTSRYKSEFLANMSHELRTPLNSLLVLAQMLAENDEGNLTEDQEESAQVIYNSGNELLELINDILDLSKVEAGKMIINFEDVDVSELCNGINTLFKPLSEKKNLDFSVTLEQGTVQTILSDSQRLMQIIKNFLSNAFKFTESGGIYVKVFPAVRKGRYGEDSYVAFSVRDTGIGIPEDKQSAIFDAFRQADGSTSRKYGGTGLGLAISRELSSMLGGLIELDSVEGEGTTFTVLLPDNPVSSLTREKVYADSYQVAIVDGEEQISNSDMGETRLKLKETEANHTEDSLNIPELDPEKPCLLLIEDDPNFVDILKRIAEKHSFQYIHADIGTSGLQLAQAVRPDAIILDLGLPDMDGQDVLTELKSRDSTKNIPVHIISGRDPASATMDEAIGYLFKPVSMGELNRAFVKLSNMLQGDLNRVLILDSDKQARDHLGSILTNKGIDVALAATAREAESLIYDNPWQCLVMDCDLEDSSGIEFLKKTREHLGERMPFVIVHTAREMTEAEHNEFQMYTNTMVLKGDSASEDRVLDEVSLFLHSVEKVSSAGEKDNLVTPVSEKTLEGHKVLLVDDDLRNTFTLSKALQGMGMDVVIADNGKVALEKLDDEGDVELVLMDIMMPVMDGFEATRALRNHKSYKDLPVIVLTAKSTAEDRSNCINAGANDYMTKPVDMDKLVAMLKVWLSK